MWSQKAANLIARFRGLPESESRSTVRPAHSLGTLVEVLIQKHHIDEDTVQEVIRENWERIVGHEFAGQASPEKIDPSGRLIIRTANAIVRREMHFREEGMMTTLRSLPKCEVIEGIRLIAG